MMGSSTIQKTLKIKVDADLVADCCNGEYHPVYFQENNCGINVAKSVISVRSNGLLSLVGAHGIVHLPTISNSDIQLDKGTVVDVLPICCADFPQISHNDIDGSNTSVSVGVITIGDISKKDLYMMIPMINSLFSGETQLAVTNESKNEVGLTQSLMNWVKGSCSKHVIFTIGGTSQKDEIQIRKVTQKVVDRVLNNIVDEMIDVYKAGKKDLPSYQGTIGICDNTLIVNLPGQVEVAKYYTEQLVDFVESIVHVLEK